MKNYTEFCNEMVTEIFRIIDEKGSLLAWRKEWSSKATIELPQGIRGYYKGANLLKLLIRQQRDGFASAQWLTFKQVQQLGAKIRKGAKGTQICFWKRIEKSAQDEQDNGDTTLLSLFRTYTVFNREQTTLDASAIVQPAYAVGSISELLRKHQITVEHYGSHAYYLPGDDAIVMPHPSQFSHENAYLATLLHEIAHWSGTHNRLNRSSLSQYSADVAARAQEELVAEICSVFLATHFGVVGELENHASYVASWKTLLKPAAIAQAVSAAGKAFQWLINPEEETA